jgi:restriction system protein
MLKGRNRIQRENLLTSTLCLLPYKQQGVSKAAVRSMITALDEQTGTPQKPVDWSDPDTWIVERLNGNDAQLAQHIWQGSNHAVGPRYIAGALYLINLYEIDEEYFRTTVEPLEEEHVLQEDLD